MNAPPLLAILMATAVRRGNTEGIPQMWYVQGYLGSHWMLPLGKYLLCIALEAARATGKQTTMNTYTYFAGCFDGHGDAPVDYRVHCLMEEVQGFTRSHCMPPLG
jgi:hypothetical protein